jgi:hypothetical protein
LEKKKKAQLRKACTSQTKEILDELQQQRNVDNLMSENPLKYEGNLEFYTAEGQIRRERLKSEPRMKKELKQWFNHRCYLLPVVLTVNPSLS